MPDNKIATRAVYFDETGKRVRTKKEITGEDGAIRRGCTVIPKGEIYEHHMFTTKDTFFKSKGFLAEVKELLPGRLIFMSGRRKSSPYSIRIAYICRQRRSARTILWQRKYGLIPHHRAESKVDFGASDPSGKAAETEARYRHGSIQRNERAFAPAQKVCIRDLADTGHRTNFPHCH